MSLDVKNKELEVVSHLEAFLLFIVFSFILYILYPKEMLQEQVLAESSNYDLTAIYLENMIRIEPENRELALALIESSSKSGKFALTLKMIDVLSKDADKAFLQELDRYRFEALKIKYFSTNEERYQKGVRAEISELLRGLILHSSYDEKDLEYWYKGAREFSMYTPALEFLNRLIQRDEKLQWLEECFYLSGELKNSRLQGECLAKLQKIDEKWTEQAYYLARKEGKSKRAILLLQDMSKRSLYWKKELAKFYIELKMYKKASKEYMKLYKSSTSYRDKKAYLKKALQALQYGSLSSASSTLARQYEAQYYRDKKMSMYIIKLYLSAGKLDDAKRVSIQRLKYIE